MNKVKFFIICLVYLGNASAQEAVEPPVIGLYALPDSGYQAASFSACSLYKFPSKKSPILDQIPMNSTVIIDTSIQVDYSILENRPAFYKVRFKGKKGYIQSSQLAHYRMLDPVTKTTFLFMYAVEQEYHAKEDYTEYHHNLFYKEVNNSQLIQEGYLTLTDDLFQLYLTEPRGLTGINNLFIIDYFAEACGEDGGQDYYTWKPGEFDLIAHLAEVGDGGVYYFVEKFIFPTDSTGEPNKLKYESEEFELFDEETNWYSELRQFRTYDWIDGVLQPAFRREYGIEEESETEIETDTEK
jgi:hypothetical protein